VCFVVHSLLFTLGAEWVPHRTMNSPPPELDISISTDEIQANNCCEGVLQLLKTVRPAWFGSEEAKSLLKSKVGANLKIPLINSPINELK